MHAARRAGIIVIGNEVLSGKITDINSTYLIGELRDLGVTVGRVTIIPDDLDAIAEQVRIFTELFDPVMSSGGVGPTHDDKTMEGVARAFGNALERSAELEDVIRTYFGERLEPAHLRMALVPQGTELIWSPGLLFPVLKVRNLWILPGDPTVMRKKFGAIRELFRQAPFHVRRIWTTLDEGKIAGLLDEVERSLPDLQVGSYPVYDTADWAVQITVESKNAADVETAFARLRDGLGEKHIWKVQ